MDAVRVGDRFRVNLAGKGDKRPLWAPCTCVQVTPRWFRVEHDVYGYSMCFLYVDLGRRRLIRYVAQPT